MKRVCVYCGSASGAPPEFRAAAQSVGTLLAPSLGKWWECPRSEER